MAYDLTILEEGCQELGITLDEVQKKQYRFLRISCRKK